MYTNLAFGATTGAVYQGGDSSIYIMELLIASTNGATIGKTFASTHALHTAQHTVCIRYLAWVAITPLQSNWTCIPTVAPRDKAILKIGTHFAVSSLQYSGTTLIRKSWNKDINPKCILPNTMHFDFTTLIFPTDYREWELSKLHAFGRSQSTASWNSITRCFSYFLQFSIPTRQQSSRMYSSTIQISRPYICNCKYQIAHSF